MFYGYQLSGLKTINYLAEKSAQQLVAITLMDFFNIAWLGVDKGDDR